jgi:spore coat protein U-like protein
LPPAADAIAARFAAILTGAILLAAIAGAPAQAQSCTVANASGSYGNVDVLSGAAVDSTSTLTVTCTGNTNATVRLCIEMGAGIIPRTRASRH